MLILSRQVDQTIVIGDDIRVTVVDVRGDKIRIGVEAPKEIPVHRLEVAKAIARGEEVPFGSPAETPTVAVEPEYPDISTVEKWEAAMKAAADRKGMPADEFETFLGLVKQRHAIHRLTQRQRTYLAFEAGQVDPTSGRVVTAPEAG